MPTPQDAGFTGTTEEFNTASLESLFSSFSSEFTKTTDNRFTGTGTSATRTPASGSNASNSGASGTPAAAQSSSTTFATSVSPTAGVSDSATASLHNSASITATNAASNTSGAVTVSETSSCNSISCSSALKAAIAVPVVVAAIAAILLFFFCARRRRKRAGAVVSEKRPTKTGKKKWTRHLRAFSFDAELLMGGRFSSSNSLRSRDPSVRSGAGPSSRDGSHSTEPSVHSIEEVAPPYRDAITHVTPPSPPRSIPAVAGVGAVPIPRSASTATAPPPYRSIVDNTPHEPPSPSTVRNPFSDSAPVSPIDESPFNDPPEAGGALAPALSRGSSMYRSVNTDDAATPTASDAGSVREAMVGRRVSVRNAGSTSGGSS